MDKAVESGAYRRLMLTSLMALLLCACAANEPVATGINAEPEPVVEISPAASAVEPTQAESGEQPNLPVAPVERFDRANVEWIQQRLQDLGYYEGAVDGSAGKATREAIKEYQRDQDIEPDGRPTAEFREFLWRNGG